jgi:Bacterial protein of unknown function (DUF903)
MKRALISLVLLFLVAVCGCARHYMIKLNNGGEITTYSKPQLKNGSYHFKDAKGNMQSLPAGRVAEIAPQSMAKEEKPAFKPETR